MHIPEGWKLEGNELARKFTFEDFGAAWAFMSSVAIEAERLNHHPDWRNVYNSVEIRLSTHDAGEVTEKDAELAEAINAIVS